MKYPIYLPTIQNPLVWALLIGEIDTLGSLIPGVCVAITFSMNLTQAIRTPSFSDRSQICIIRAFTCVNFPHNEDASEEFLHLIPIQYPHSTTTEKGGKYGHRDSEGRTFFETE